MKKTLHLLFILLITLQVAVKAQDRVYWGIPNKNIGSAKLDGTDVTLSVALSGQTFDMETDFYKGILYWGDDSSVKKANTDGTNLQTLYTGSKTIGGLALDLTSNKLYFSEFQSGNVIIRRCNLDGTGMEVIVTSPNSNGRTYNLTISTTLQKLYWTESTAVNTNSIIMRCNLDGTNFETLMTTTKFIPGLTIDEKNQRLYLAYWDDNKVMTTDMTCSTTPTLVFGSSNGTFQMAVSNVDDKLYFGEMGSKKIRKCNLDGSLPQDIVSGLLGQPMALSIPTVPPAPTIYANDTYTFELNDFLFASVDKNLLTKIKINTLTSKGTLYLDANNNNIVDAGEEVGLNQEIAKTDIVAGKLKFNPLTNDYGSPYTTFNFKWFDGTSYSTLDYLQYIYVLSVAPTVTTQAVSDIGSTTATGNGNITNLGVPFPTSYGVCWNTAGSPTTSDSKVDKGPISTTGAFPASMTGLTANTTYKVRAYAINEAGTSYGTEVTFTTNVLTAPTATTSAATSITSTGGATLNGVINANNTSTVVTFQYGLTTSYGTTVTADQSPVTGSTTISVSKAITGLTAGITYHYRVVGVNAGGTTTGLDQSFTTLTTTVPNIPVGVIASPGVAKATVYFAAPASDGGSPVTLYTVTSTPEGKIATGTASPITIEGLTNGVTYTFTVTATNIVGNSLPSAASNEIRTPLRPGVPDNITAIAGDRQATVSFRAPEQNGGNLIYKYTVTSSVGGFTQSGSSSPLTLTGLTNGISYTFTVFATNEVGNGPASTPSAAVTPYATTTTWRGTGNWYESAKWDNGGPGAGSSVTIDGDVTFSAFGTTALPVKASVNEILHLQNSVLTIAANDTLKVTKAVTNYGTIVNRGVLIGTVLAPVVFEENGGAVVPDLMQEFGTSLVLPKPTKAGYAFVDWCTDKDLKQIYTPIAMQLNRLTLYALWQLSTGVVTLEEETLKVYPNPATDGFTVTAADQESTLTISEMNGRKVLTLKVSGDSYVDVSALTPGIYIVSVDGRNCKLIKK